MRAVFALLAFTNPTWAGCLVGEETFVSCRIENSTQSLRVCFDEETIDYRFGTMGQPHELELREPIATIDYLPWPGVGRSIWEIVRFKNEGYTYETIAGFERMWGDEEFEDIPHRSFGSVRVKQGDTIIAELTCQRATVDFAWGEGLFAAKQRLGYSWDFDTDSWVRSVD